MGRMITFDFSDQIVLVTGAASGIGLAQTKAFLAAGAKVFAIDKNALTLSDENLYFYQGDVSRERFWRNVGDLLPKNLEHIDIVCNTAGLLDAYRPLTETSMRMWNKIMAVDLRSQFLSAQVTLPLMLKQKHGVFVNMASIAGLVAGGGGVAYTAAKHAVIGLTKQIDLDYAKDGIRANCLAPGAIDTPMNAADFIGDAHMAKEVAEQTPAKRWAKPEEVANLTLFLASDEADYIHGAVVPIDGGWLES